MGKNKVIKTDQNGIKMNFSYKNENEMILKVTVYTSAPARCVSEGDFIEIVDKNVFWTTRNSSVKDVNLGTQIK